MKLVDLASDKPSDAALAGQSKVPNVYGKNKFKKAKKLPKVKKGVYGGGVMFAGIGAGSGASGGNSCGAAGGGGGSGGGAGGGGAGP